jgi:hypothetical protein
MNASVGIGRRCTPIAAVADAAKEATGVEEKVLPENRVIPTAQPGGSQEKRE